MEPGEPGSAHGSRDLDSVLSKLDLGLGRIASEIKTLQEVLGTPKPHPAQDEPGQQSPPARSQETRPPREAGTPGPPPSSSGRPSRAPDPPAPAGPRRRNLIARILLWLPVKAALCLRARRQGDPSGEEVEDSGGPAPAGAGSEARSGVLDPSGTEDAAQAPRSTPQTEPRSRATKKLDFLAREISRWKAEHPVSANPPGFRESDLVGPW